MDRRLVLSCVLCSLTPSLFGQAPATRTARLVSQVGPWKIERQTPALEVTAVDTTRDRETITLKNVSSRVITAYVVSAASMSVHTFESIGSGPAHPPGETWVWTIGPELGRSVDQTIRILAVVFEDGSTEGNTPKIRELQYQRMGMLLEYARIDRILAAHRGVVVDKDVLNAAIGRLPETSDEAMRSLANVKFSGRSTREIHPSGPDHPILDRLMDAFLGGVRVARETAQMRLASLDDPSGDTTGDPLLRRSARFDRMMTEFKNKVKAFDDYVTRTGGVLR
jgi:hypothetical protein